MEADVVLDFVAIYLLTYLLNITMDERSLSSVYIAARPIVCCV